MTRDPKRLEKNPAQTRRANPADFDKKTSPVRERMAKQMKDMPPAERMKKGPAAG